MIKIPKDPLDVYFLLFMLLPCFPGCSDSRTNHCLVLIIGWPLFRPPRLSLCGEEKSTEFLAMVKYSKDVVNESKGK